MLIHKDKPTVNDVHVNRPLTTISVAYLQDENNYVADKVFPMVPVNNRSDVYFTYNKDDFRRGNLIIRPPSTESAGGGYRIDAEQTYRAKVYGWHVDISDQVRDNADDPLNQDADAAKFIMQTLLIGREKLWSDTYFTTGVWGTDLVGGTGFTKWSAANSDPEADIDDQKIAILQNTGKKANTLVVDLATHLRLKKHPLVQERFKYTSSDSITTAMLAAFFEIDRYLVGMASHNAAAEHATASNQMILGDNALLAYVAPQPRLMEPSAGYIFTWKGLSRTNPFGVATTNLRMPELKADRIETEMAFDMKVVSADCGVFFSDTL